jgi:hypothetical protein
MKPEVSPSSLGNQNSTNKQTLRVGEIAKMAGVHPVTVRRAIKRGALQSVSAIRHKIVSIDQVTAWIAGRGKEETK